MTAVVGASSASAASEAPVSAGATAFAETVLVVPGMHCAGCMSKVEKALAALPGVSAARVNLTARQVRVSHDGAVAIPDLVDALSAVGFPSQPRGEELAAPPSAVRPLLAPLAVAGFACMNVMLLSVSIWSGADGQPIPPSAAAAAGRWTPGPGFDDRLQRPGVGHAPDVLQASRRAGSSFQGSSRMGWARPDARRDPHVRQPIKTRTETSVAVVKSKMCPMIRF